MHHIHVTCAIIERNGLVMAAQRSALMKMPLKWEFPGGKLDPGESPEDCLLRELAEEMNLNVSIKQTLPATTHDYPDIRVTLYPFICSIGVQEATLYEHSEITWLLPEELKSLDWAEADLSVIDSYFSWLKRTAQ